MKTTNDITIRVIGPDRNPDGTPTTADTIKKAIWRRAHGGTLTTFKVVGIDWRRGKKQYHYKDDDDVWDNLKGILRTVGWNAIRIAKVDNS